MANATMNLGLPLYQDSDIPDLTNQYNASMNILDSYLMRPRTAKCLLFGDSWAAPKENIGFLEEYLGLEVINYGVSGGQISGDTEGRDLRWQISQAEHDQHENVEVIILLMGVNDLQNGVDVSNIYAVLNNQWAEFIASYPCARTYWFLNGPNTTQANYGTYIATLKKMNYSYYNIQQNSPFVCANIIPYLYMLKEPLYYKEDGLHPTDGEGHRLVCRIMAGIIKYGCFTANTKIDSNIGIAQTYYAIYGDNLYIASNAAGSGTINATASAILNTMFPWSPTAVALPTGTIDLTSNAINIERPGIVSIPIVNRG